MTKYDKLRLNAVVSAVFRGHKLGNFRRSTVYPGVGVARCQLCSARVFIDMNPPPNGIDVSGAAVGTNCRGTPWLYADEENKCRKLGVYKKNK